MGQDKKAANKIQDYYNLSLNYLESARISLKNELFEPAMFSAIHALELSLKAALLTKQKMHGRHITLAVSSVNISKTRLVIKPVKELM